MSVRAVEGSALDALADGPQARWLGVTRRLHDVASRYSFLVGSLSLAVPLRQVPKIAAAAGPIPPDPRLLRQWLVNAAMDAELGLCAEEIRNASDLAVILLAETIEEAIARA